MLNFIKRAKAKPDTPSHNPSAVSDDLLKYVFAGYLKLTQAEKERFLKNHPSALLLPV